MTHIEDDQALTVRRPRQTQEQRSGATREKLIASAIDCLHAYGYAATTTNLIADKAGVSRGALQHQFGARIDLMTAVAEAALERQAKISRQGLARFAVGKSRFIGLTEINWESIKDPASVAVIEIMMACRSDPDLRARFAALADADNKTHLEEIWAGASRAGVRGRGMVDAMAQLHRAALLGLSLQAMMWRDERTIKPGFELLRWYKGLLTERLLAGPDAESEVVAAYLREAPVRSVVSELDVSSYTAGAAPARSLITLKPRTLDPRGEETRLKAIQAAITCLCDYGYAETTTLRVADIANVSRGAIQQQFRTRLELMLGVLEHIIFEQHALFDDEIDETLPPRERFIAITDIIWRMYSRPSGIAISELLLASRSDPDLSEHCRAVTMQSAANDNRTWLAAEAAGIQDVSMIRTMRILHRAALRGLVIVRMLSSNPDVIKPSLDLLRWYKTILTDHLIATAKDRRK